MAGNNPEWTSEQMIENASNWSLAGDVALFNSLKKFSEGLLSETVSISANVDNLLNNLETVSLKLDLTKNEFQSLRNTQFIENRVYEDDETIANNEIKKEEKELTEEEKESIIRESILKGLKVMENYYEKVQVSVSDSEEDVQEKSYILQPKDLYADRPLPYLVGSKEWYKSWHVGLLPSESESESEKEEEVYSSSDSEEMLPKDKILGSETSSELDFTNRTTGPVANSTFNDTQDRRSHSSDESSELSGSLPPQVPVSNESFAEQLAAKLGHVIDKTNDSLEHVNRNPIKKLQQPTKYGNLFSDEPPPLDEDLDETVLPKSAHEGLFSGGRDLFVDSQEEDLFFGQPKSSAQNEQEQKEAASLIKPKSLVSKGLFDNSDSSSEDDMFMAAEKRQVKVAKPFLQPFKPTIPFIDNQPPEITSKSESEPTKKKPIGGVSIFGEKAGLFGDSSGKPGFEGSKTAVNSQKSRDISKKPENIKKSLKKTSLFDESSSEDEETPKRKDILTKEPEKLQTSKNLSLFDDSEDDMTPKAQNTSNLPHKKKKESLFHDDIDENDDDGFPPKKEENSELSVKNKKINIFNEDPYQNIDLFRPTTKEITDKKESFKKASIETNKPAKKVSLFDDDDDFLKEEEDIFASVPIKKSLFDDFGVSSITKSSKSLFEDLEGDTASVSKDIKSKKSSSSLFDNLESSQSSDSFIGSSTYEENIVKEIEDSKKTFSKEDPSEEPKKDMPERLFDDLADSDNSKDFIGDSDTTNLVNSEETDPKQRILADTLFEYKDITIEGSAKKNDSTKSGEEDKSIWPKDLKEEKAVKSIFEDLESSAEEENIFKPNKVKKSKTENILEDPVKDLLPIDQKAILFEDEDADILVDVLKTKDHEPQNEQVSPKNKDTKATGLPKYEDQDQKKQYNESKDVVKPNTLGKVRKSVGFLDSDSTSDESFEKTNKDKKTHKEESLFIGKKSEENLDINKTEELTEASQSKDSIPDVLPDENNKDLDERDAIPPPIDLFDPTPPPPDPNWDAGSDNSGESDTFSLTDGILDRTTFNQSQARSSLFDEAPPSLDVNESSGIVRDLNATRPETDDSSFYPYASSSRRFSSDLFSEQQSQDSFFVTKNKTESSGQSGTNLGNIPEKSENMSSMISNLTPSGNVDDFDDSSVFEEKSSEVDSMSSASNFGEKPQVAKRVSLFERKIGGDGGEISAKKIPDIVRKSASFFEEKSDVDKGNGDKLGDSPVKASPGKLKHSLSINVGALLPGASRPKPRPSIAKSISLDETDESNAPTLRRGVTADDPPSTSRVAKSRSEIFSGKEAATAPSDDQKFDNLGQAEVLVSATKDRVRIPVKRRPSTRKARQEAVRKSMPDFDMATNEENVPETEPKDHEPTQDVKNSFLKELSNKLGAPEDGLKTETSGPDAGKTKKEEMNDKLRAPEDGLKKETSGPDTNETKEINDKLRAPEDDLKKETSGPDTSETEEIKHKLRAPEDGLKKETPGSDASKTKKEEIIDKLGVPEDGPKRETSGPDTSETKKGEEPVVRGISLVFGKTSAKEEKLNDNFKAKSEDFLASALKPSETLESEEFTTESKSIFEDSLEDQSELFASKKSDAKEVYSSLFGGTDSDSSSKLFGGAFPPSTKQEPNKLRKIEPISTKKNQQSSIFSDKSDDEDDDLFGGKSRGSEKKILGATSKKSSIFDDSGDSDDEDLFGAKTSKSRGASGDADENKDSNVSVRSVQNKINKTTAVKKLENKEVTDFDPLSAFK